MTRTRTYRRKQNKKHGGKTDRKLRQYCFCYWCTGRAFHEKGSLRERRSNNEMKEYEIK
ncbi:MAG TPA: hypothetical protein VMX17_02695 [Candidatus Glassbacteria bacterium]|nr:hypothetical protein [Candidatus Glassbacteria bacterium]